MRITFKKRVNTFIIISFRGRDHYIWVIKCLVQFIVSLKEQSSKPTDEQSESRDKLLELAKWLGWS